MFLAGTPQRCQAMSTSSLTLDTLIPLSEAAHKFGLTEAHLRALVEKGTIRAGKLPSGDVVVSEQDTQAQKPTKKEELPEYKKHMHLKGQTMGLGEAARKYSLPVTTLSGWVSKGYIKQIGQDGQRLLLDEVDVAYCAEIYQRRKGQGRWLFNRDGTPYS